MTRTRARAPRSLVTLATVALALCTAGPLGFAVTQRDADGSARRVQVTGLAEVFTETWALEDRNGDSQADFIAARIVVPETPAPEELAAATAIAARLGLETSGLTLPLVFRPGDPEPADGPRIVVGTDNPELDPAMATRARALAAGQGLVAMSATTVVVAGGDDAGTQAAAEAFAARSPYLWAVIGTSERRHVRPSRAGHRRTAHRCPRAGFGGHLRRAGLRDGPAGSRERPGDRRHRLDAPDAGA